MFYLHFTLLPAMVAGPDSRRKGGRSLKSFQVPLKIQTLPRIYFPPFQGLSWCPADNGAPSYHPGLK